MYDKFLKLLENQGVSAYKVSQATGISQQTFTDWKAGRYTPKQEKIQKIAEYFNVPVSYFYGEEEEPKYYFDEETAAMAQALHDNPELKALFKASRKLSPKDIETFVKLIEGYKNEG